jgi:hypothetical protein
MRILCLVQREIERNLSENGHMLLFLPTIRHAFRYQLRSTQKCKSPRHFLHHHRNLQKESSFILSAQSHDSQRSFRRISTTVWRSSEIDCRMQGVTDELECSELTRQNGKIRQAEIVETSPENFRLTFAQLDFRFAGKIAGSKNKRSLRAIGEAFEFVDRCGRGSWRGRQI